MSQRNAEDLIKSVTMYTQSGYLPPAANLELMYKRLRDQEQALVEFNAIREQGAEARGDAEVEITALKADVESLNKDLAGADAGYDLLCRILVTYTKAATVEDMSASEKEAYEAARSRGVVLERRHLRSEKAA